MNYIELHNLQFESEYLLETLCGIRSAIKYNEDKNKSHNLAQKNLEFSKYYDFSKSMVSKVESNLDELNVNITNLHKFCEDLSEQLKNYSQTFLSNNMGQLVSLSNLEEISSYLKFLDIEILGVDDHSASIESINEVVSLMEHRMSLVKNGERKVITIVSAIIEDKIESTIHSGHFLVRGFRPTSEDNEEMAEFIKTNISSNSDDVDKSFLENL